MANMVRVFNFFGPNRSNYLRYIAHGLVTSSHMSFSSLPTTPGPVSLLPKKARVVVIGGGIIGASVGYHFGKRNWGKICVFIVIYLWLCDFLYALYVRGSVLF